MTNDNSSDVEYRVFDCYPVSCIIWRRNDLLRGTKMLIIIVLLYTINVVKTSELSETVLFIANKEFEQRPSILVIWGHSDQNIVTDFLNNYHGSVTIIKIKGNPTNISEFSEDFNYKQTIFFASDPEEFEYFLVNINKTVIYPIRILLVLTVPVEETSILEKYTKLCFDNDVTDILIVSKNFQDNITLTTYMPYDGSGCGNYTPIFLNSDTKNMFPSKFNNFHGCPIKVVIAKSFPYVLPSDDDPDNIRGIDTDLLTLVFEKLNSTMLKSLRNESGKDIFGFVANGTFDMSLPSLILKPKSYKTAQASQVYKTLDVVLCGPNQREIYAWAKVLLPFFTSTTPLIVLSFLIFMGSIALIQHFGMYQINSPKGIIFGTLGLFLGQEVKFETKYWLNNGLFMLWIWYCTVVRTAYQGDLVDGLQETFLEPHLETAKQAVDVLDEYGGPSGLLQLFGNLSAKKNPKVVSWTDIPEYIEEISKGRRFLLVTDISFIRHSPFRVQMVDERLSSLPQVFFMRPRWGGAKEVNRRMEQLFECGFVTKIIREYQFHAKIETTSGGFEPIAMTTVASCFIGLVIMASLWSMVLCIEILWYRFVRNLMLF